MFSLSKAIWHCTIIKSIIFIREFGVLAGNHVRIMDKSFGDFIFLCGLEIATSHGIPMQIHTGYKLFFTEVNKVVCEPCRWNNVTGTL